MKGKEKISYWMNPAWGLMPFLLYAFLVIFISFQQALLISFMGGLGSLFLLPSFLRHKVFPFFLFVSVAILGVNCSFLLLPLSVKGILFVRIFPELVLFLFTCMLLSFGRIRFVKWMYRFQRRYLNFSIKQSLYETFFTLRLIKNTVIVFLIIVLSYFLFFRDAHTPQIHRLLLGGMRFVFILTLISFSQIRLYWLNKRFQNEDWLPIIDEDAQVIGKIARSVSYQFKEKYLHPHLRILLFYKGKVYLQVHEKTLLSEGKGYDTPLSMDLCYSQDFPTTINILMRNAELSFHLRPKFFTRYLFERANLRRMVFLYTLILPDDSFLSGKFFRKGKLWTEQEIDNNIGKGVFSAGFEEEYELLKTTVFPVMKMMY